MDFIVQWFGYLLAFVAGSALAWGMTVLFLSPRRAQSGAEDDQTGEQHR